MGTSRPNYHLVKDGNLSEIIDELRIVGNPPVLVVLGGAKQFDAEVAADFEHTLRTAIAPIADELKAIVIDGGTDSGVMRSVGKVFHEAAQGCRLIGIAPAGKILRNSRKATGKDDRQLPAPFHQDLILSEGKTWGSELDDLVGVVERLSEHSQVLVVVAGGGKNTAAELKRVDQRQWPILVLTGTGGKADRLHASAKSRTRQLPQHFMKRVARLWQPGKQSAQFGETFLQAEFRSVRDVSGIRRSIFWRFSEKEDIVRLAWERVAAYEEMAQESQPRSKWVVWSVLLLGVATTVTGFVAILSESIPQTRYALVVLPVITTSILGFAVRRRRYDRWIMVRVAAEALKQDIFRYRCLVKPYHQKRIRSSLLAARLEAVDNRLVMDVPVAVVRRAPVHWPPDSLDGAAHAEDLLIDQLSVERYIQLRVQHQLDYLERAVSKEDRWITRNAVTMTLFALVAVIVAAVSSESVAIALAAILAAMSAAVAAGIAYGQGEQRVAKMTVAAVGLRAAQANFIARRVAGRKVDVLEIVAASEDALAQESQEWYRSLRQSFGMVDTAHGR